MVWGTWGQAQDGIYAEYTWNEVAHHRLVARPVLGRTAARPRRTTRAWRSRTAGRFSTVMPRATGCPSLRRPTAPTPWVRNDPTHRGEAEDGGWSTVTFEPVETTGLRLVLHPHATIEGASIPYYGTAVAEWGVHAVEGEDPEPEPRTGRQDRAEGRDRRRVRSGSEPVQPRPPGRCWRKRSRTPSPCTPTPRPPNPTSPPPPSALEDAQKNLVAKADKSRPADRNRRGRRARLQRLHRGHLGRRRHRPGDGQHRPAGCERHPAGRGQRRPSAERCGRRPGDQAGRTGRGPTRPP